MPDIILQIVQVKLVHPFECAEVHICTCPILHTSPYEVSSIILVLPGILLA
jgi:hypothetical protein